MGNFRDYASVDDPKPIEAPQPSTKPKPVSESPKASAPNVVDQKMNGDVSTAAVLGSTAAALCFLVLCIICLCRKCKGIALLNIMLL